MTYRPPNQALEEPIEKILEGVKEFDSAVDERIENGDFIVEHLEEIDDLRHDLNKLKIRLSKIRKDTW